MIISTDTGKHLTNFKQTSQCIKNKRELPQPLKSSTKNLEFTSDLMVKDWMLSLHSWELSKDVLSHHLLKIQNSTGRSTHAIKQENKRKCILSGKEERQVSLLQKTWLSTEKILRNLQKRSSWTSKWVQ